MPNLCARCGSRVSYFERRFAHRNWFCGNECLARWQPENTGGRSLAYPSTTARPVSRSLRQTILKGIVGAAAVLLTLAASLFSLLLIGGMESIARYPWWVALAWMAVIAALGLLAFGSWYVYRRI